MNYRRRLGLLSNSFTVSAVATGGWGEDGRPESTLFCLPSSSVSLPYFNHAVTMLKCSKEHSCVSSTFYSHTEWNSAFRSAKTAVSSTEAECS